MMSLNGMTVPALYCSDVKYPGGEGFRKFWVGMCRNYPGTLSLNQRYSSSGFFYPILE